MKVRDFFFSRKTGDYYFPNVNLECETSYCTISRVYKKSEVDEMPNFLHSKSIWTNLEGKILRDMKHKKTIFGSGSP